MEPDRRGGAASLHVLRNNHVEIRLIMMIVLTTVCKQVFPLAVYIFHFKIYLQKMTFSNNLLHII